MPFVYLQIWMNEDDSRIFFSNREFLSNRNQINVTLGVTQLDLEREINVEKFSIVYVK